MLKLIKAFGNTGYDIGCWAIISLRVFVTDDSALVEIGGYKDLDSQVAGKAPLTTESVTLKGITAILQGGGKTYIENLESAIMQVEGYDKAAVATAEEVAVSEAKIGK